jgi:hypothetical protein
MLWRALRERLNEEKRLTLPLRFPVSPFLPFPVSRSNYVGRPRFISLKGLRRLAGGKAERHPRSTGKKNPRALEGRWTCVL